MSPTERTIKISFLCVASLTVFNLALDSVPTLAQGSDYSCARLDPYLDGLSNHNCTGQGAGTPFTNTRRWDLTVWADCKSSNWSSGIVEAKEDITIWGNGQCRNDEGYCNPTFGDWNLNAAQGNAVASSTHYKRVSDFPFGDHCETDGGETFIENIATQTCAGEICCGNCTTYCSSVGECNYTTCECVWSPIVISLDGDKIELTHPVNGVRFDLAANGRPSVFAWTTPNARTAFLALDRNANGVIDDGAELFGTVTAQPTPTPPQKVNGFSALAVYDVNGDLQITAADPIFSQLVLWRDANHNGTTEAGELLGLTDVGLISVGLEYNESRHQDQFGNIFRYRAKVLFSDAHKQGAKWAYDVFLKGL